MNRRVRTIDEELYAAQTGIGRWVLPAFLFSLLLHGVFWLWANNFQIDRFSDAFYERIVPRTFHLERVEIDPKLLDPSPEAEKRSAAAPTAVKLPDENYSFEKSMSEGLKAPIASQLDDALLKEKPMLPTASFQNTMQIAETTGARSLVPDDKALTEELLNEKPAVTGSSIIELSSPQNLSGSAISRAGSFGIPAGFSNLDDLLAQTGPLTPETAPILMPADLLYDYNAVDLRSEAVESLNKLGILLQRNPSIRLIIQGHTDSFGSDDYNLDLSKKRAESVKNWLIQVMGMPAESIETKGFGKTRLIAPGDGTIEEQQINRRVEIVIRAPAATSIP